MRLLVALLVVLLVSPMTTPPAVASDVRPPRDRSDVAMALGLLHAWDARRAQAWADEDEQALALLYVPGSRAGRADVRLLRSYVAGDLVVRRLVTQVFSIRVLERSPGRVTVRVLDRVAGGEVEHAGNLSPLPGTRPVVHRVELRRTLGAWRVASVSG